MPLYTKSSQLPRSPEDGIRVCIMRRPEKEVDWDIWMPHLAPSHELLTGRHRGTITKEEFNKIFTLEVLQGNVEYLQILIEMAMVRVVTILCFELDPLTCHRFLVAEECRRLESQLKVSISAADAQT